MRRAAFGAFLALVSAFSASAQGWFPLAVPPIVQPLRPVASRPLVGQGFVSGLGGTAVQGQSRERMYLADAPISEIRVCYGNWGGAGEVAGPGNLVIEAALESDGPLGVQRFLWSGANTVTIAAGATACSDPLFPAAFGLTVFPANATMWFRTGATAVSNLGFPYGNISLTNPGEGMWAGPAFTSQVVATGAMTTPSGGAAASGMITPFAVIGRFTTPNMPGLCDIGDSISAGINDTAMTELQGVLGGNGYIGRAAYGSAGTQIYPTLKLGIIGDGANASYTQRATFFQYCTHGIDGEGINQINSQTAAAILAQLEAQWTSMHNAGIQYIWQTLITPQTTSTDSWLTEANQTYVSGNFGPGGVKDQLNTLITADIGTHNLTGTINIPGTVAGVDPDKWTTTIVSATTSYTPNVTCTSGSKIFTFSSGTFAAADVGKTIRVAGCGASSGTYQDVIAVVTSTTQITMTTNNAGTSQTAAAELTVYGWPAVSDGLHPLGYTHAAIAPLVTTVLQSVGPQLPAVNNSWVPTGADWSMDFKNGRYFGVNCPAVMCYPLVSSSSGITRASVGWGVTKNDSTGTLIEFGPITARIVPGRGLLAEKTTTNLFTTPFSPATQTVTVSNSTQYTASITGTGSMDLSGACTHTGVVAGTPFTCTTGSTSLTATINGSPTSMQVETGAIATSPISGTRTAEDIGLLQIVNNYLATTAGTIVVTYEGTTPQTGAILAAFGANYLNQASTTTINNNRTVTLTATLGAGANGHTVDGLTWDGTGRGLDGNGGTIATDANATGITLNAQVYLSGQGNGGGDTTNTNYVQQITHYPGRLTGATTPTFQQATTP